jgi:acetolactate synthase-1/2/3 large subunit
VILAGSAVARAFACEALATFAERLDALVATTPDGRDAFDNRHPRFIGVSGAMGHAEVERALADARLVVAVGTRLPLLARQGLERLLSERRLLSIGHDPPFVAGRESLHLDGEIAVTLGAIAAMRGEVAPAGAAITRAPASMKTSGAALPNAARLSSATVLGAVDFAVPRGGVVLVDAGNTGASAIHHVRAPHGGRFFVAMGMAGMGWAFGAATGAALATGKRCFVIAGDGAFFMHGMEIHTAVEHALPITYVILNNRAHGMCLVRERLLLGENAGYNAFRASHIGAGLAAMFPGLLAADCTNQGELASLLARASATDGPSVIAVELDELEVPPFAAFQKLAPGATAVAREADDA